MVSSIPITDVPIIILAGDCKTVEKDRKFELKRVCLGHAAGTLCTSSSKAQARTRAWEQVTWVPYPAVNHPAKTRANRISKGAQKLRYQ